VILATDKTLLTSLAGNQYAYPVYISIGNLSKDIRRKTSERGMLLLGFIPVEEFDDAPNEEERQWLQSDLLHCAMEIIMAPLKKAWEEGVETWCADGHLRRLYPMVASEIADWPEQNAMASTVASGCPSCEQPFEGRGTTRKQHQCEPNVNHLPDGLNMLGQRTQQYLSNIT
jgi:hypothetical protein